MFIVFIVVVVVVCTVGKRKRDAWDDMPTPTTPYGAHLTRDPSPGTRKYYRRHVGTVVVRPQ